MLSEKDTLDTLEESNDESIPTLKKNNVHILKLTNLVQINSNQFSISIPLYLMNLIYTNTLKIDFNVKIKKQKNDIYTSKFPPKISIGDFVNKIIKFSKTSESTFILALIYLDRFCKLNDYILTDYNTHRLFLTSLLIAKKYNEDNFYSNIFFAKVCGIKLKELNIMEYNFLVDLSFNLYVKNSITDKYRKKLLSTI